MWDVSVSSIRQAVARLQQRFGWATAFLLDGVCIIGTNVYTNSMTTIKTAVSIEENLFRRTKEAAVELEISRSSLVSLALESYLSRYEANKITAKLSEVYAEGPTAEEEELHKAMWRYHVELTKDDPW